MISIIIPVYNKVGTMDACVASIREQTFEDFEVLLVNDGSTDNCYDILEAYKNGCPALLNDIPVFREVAADCGTYFDITDGKSLNAQLEVLFETKENERNVLIEKQKERLPLFTAEKMAEGYINVYKSVLK